MKKLDREKVIKLIEETGMRPFAFAKKAGLTPESLRRWLNGQREAKIDNIIKLSIALGCSVDDITTSSTNASVDLPPYLLVPLVGNAGALTPGAGIPLIDCANEYAEKMVPFSGARPGDFAIRVSGDSMLPWYPEGSLLLCRPETVIKNGSRVVAVTDDDEVLFKIFVREGNSIHLFSINGEGQDFFFDHGRGLRYVCRVIFSQRNEDDMDSAMAEKHIHHEWEKKIGKRE